MAQSQTCTSQTPGHIVTLTADDNDKVFASVEANEGPTVSGPVSAQCRSNMYAEASTAAP